MLNGIIGIVGGMGPHAGLDLSGKIINETIAAKDQDHIPQILYSTPEIIGDRTEFILGKIKENPAINIAGILQKLEKMGCTVAGLSCNTAHAPQIFGVIQMILAESDAKIKLLHIIHAVGNFIKNQYPEINNIGILGTSGTYQSKLYDQLLDFELKTVNVTPQEQEKVHASIYHKQYGIKSTAGVIKKEARDIVHGAANFLIKNKAQLIILGCTELPLVINEPFYNSVPVLDPTLVFARALIHAHSPQKLKPWI